MMDIRINTLSEDDIAEFMFLHSALFVPNFSTTVDVRTYAQKIRQRAVSVESWEDETLIGLLAVYFNQEYAFVPYVCISNDYSGRGIGTSLFFYLDEMISKQGLKFLKLEVRINNLNAISFYEKLGFEEQERNSEKIIMIKRYE